MFGPVDTPVDNRRQVDERRRERRQGEPLKSFQEDCLRIQSGKIQNERRLSTREGKKS
jgi:hypothetical protein